LKAAVIHKPGEISFENVETPPLEPGKVLVKVKAVGISSSDIDLFKGTHPYSVQKDPYPVIPGNQWSGSVEKVGEGVVGIEKGQRVVGDTTIGCGKCTYCRAGKYHLCFSVEKAGISTNGAMAECIVVPASSVHSFSWVTYEEAALLAPFAQAIYTLKRLDIAPGSDVLVLGSNPLALASLQIAKILGASRVFASDFESTEQLKVARKVGAHIIAPIDPEKNHIGQIRDQIKKRYVAIFLETTGSQEGIPIGLRLTKRGGYMLFLKTLAQNPNEFDLNRVILKEMTIYGIGEGPGMWEDAINLTKKEQIKINPLITHKFKLKDVKSAFNIVQNRMENVIAALITP